MFQNREDAGQHLADLLRSRPFTRPVVLGIPRGGVVIGAVLARELGADLDIVLSRKLRAPDQPELAVGAVGEDGHVLWSHSTLEYLGLTPDDLVAERRFQLGEIARRQKLFRAVRPAIPVAGRSVIVTDDGIATGSTMIAALQTLASQAPHEVIVAVPVASPDRVPEIRQYCDDLVAPLQPLRFWAIGEFYEDFTQVEDEQVVQLLRGFAPGGRHSCQLSAVSSQFSAKN